MGIIESKPKNRKCPVNSLSSLTFAFFQLLIHGGIFHSFCSFTVTLRVGECITGAGGEGGPLGIFLLILKIFLPLHIMHQIKMPMHLGKLCITRHLGERFNFSLLA